MNRLAYRLLRFCRRLVPALLGLLLILLAITPSGIPQFSQIVPMFSIIAIYYWSIYRPDLMPGAAAFGLGLLQDVICGGPLGLMALVLLMVRAICVSQRRVFVNSSFIVGWWGFLFVAAGAVSAVWLISCLFYLKLFDPRPALVQFALSVFAYPAIAWTFVGAERRLLVAR